MTILYEKLRGKQWTAPDEMASEHETLQLLYALVLLMKPNVVLETGCYKGDATEAMGRALAKHADGAMLYTCDTDKGLAELTVARCKDIDAAIAVVHGSGVELAGIVDDVDLAFLDSSGDRLEEAKALKLSPRAVIVLHDARRPVLDQIIEALGWEQIFIDTPRGIALLQP